MALTLMDEKDKLPADIKDDDEGLDIEVEGNPNVDDQLEQAASDDGIGDEKAVKDDKEKPAVTPAELTAEEKYNRFMEENPDAREVHGKKTAKRIDKMTYAQKEAERQRDEAIDFAKRTHEEMTKLKKNQTTQDGAFITEHKSRLETQLDTAKRELANAYNLNDSEGVADATAKMARLSNQLDTATQTETRFKRAREEEPETAAPVHTPPTARPTQRPQPDAKAEAWAEKNEWFGEDKELTESALSIHRSLVTQEGYLPQTDAYYHALDERMRKNYPEHEQFKTAAPVVKPGLKSPSSMVAPVNSNDTRGTKPGRVHLTSSQVRVAKRLGVPLKDYAKSLESYLKDK